MAIDIMGCIMGYSWIYNHGTCFFPEFLRDSSNRKHPLFLGANTGIKPHETNEHDRDSTDTKHTHIVLINKTRNCEPETY